ncbi:hypothetical protein LSAT2_013562, partial [Lamellibrachia satsuma]
VTRARTDHVSHERAQATRIYNNIDILRRRNHTGIVPLCDITSSMRVTLHRPGVNSNIATVRARDVCYIDGTDTTHDVCYIDGTDTTRDVCYIDGTDTTRDVCYIDGTDTTHDVCYIDGTDTTRDVCYIDGTDTTQIPRRQRLVQQRRDVNIAGGIGNTKHSR